MLNSSINNSDHTELEKDPKMNFPSQQISDKEAVRITGSFKPEEFKSQLSFHEGSDSLFGTKKMAISEIAMVKNKSTGK